MPVFYVHIIWFMNLCVKHSICHCSYYSHIHRDCRRNDWMGGVGGRHGGWKLLCKQFLRRMQESKMQHQQYVILKMHWYCNSLICYHTAFKLDVLWWRLPFLIELNIVVFSIYLSDIGDRVSLLGCCNLIRHRISTAAMS